MAERIVKLARWWCTRSDDQPETRAKAVAALTSVAERLYGELWPKLAEHYTVEHFERDGKLASALLADAEHVVIHG